MTSIVRWFSADFNHSRHMSDDTELLILVTSDDNTEKYLKLEKPFTKNQLSAALHCLANNLGETE